MIQYWTFRLKWLTGLSRCENILTCSEFSKSALYSYAIPVSSTIFSKLFSFGRAIKMSCMFHVLVIIVRFPSGTKFNITRAVWCRDVFIINGEINERFGLYFGQKIYRKRREKNRKGKRHNAKIWIFLSTPTGQYLPVRKSGFCKIGPGAFTWLADVCTRAPISHRVSLTWDGEDSHTHFYRMNIRVRFIEFIHGVVLLTRVETSQNTPMMHIRAYNHLNSITLNICDSICIVFLLNMHNSQTYRSYVESRCRNLIFTNGLSTMASLFNTRSDRMAQIRLTGTDANGAEWKRIIWKKNGPAVRDSHYESICPALFSSVQFSPFGSFTKTLFDATLFAQVQRTRPLMAIIEVEMDACVYAFRFNGSLHGVWPIHNSVRFTD